MRLEENGIRLRPWREDDVPAIVSACQDEEIPRWTRVPSPYSEDDARAFVRDAGDAAFAVVDRGTGELLGSIGLVERKGPVAEIGYWVKREARGRGVATRAVRLLSRWALQELGLARLELITEPANLGSQRVAEKAGFQREGVLRSYAALKGRRRDFVMFSLLPEDL